MTERAITVRASSLGELLDCAHRWEGKHVLGMRNATSGAAHLGTSLHKATAAYDSKEVESLHHAIDVFVHSLNKPEQDVNWGDLSRRKAESVGIVLVGQYVRDWSGRYEYEVVEHTLTPLDIDVGGTVITFTGTLDRCRVVPGSDGKRRIVDVKSGARAVSFDDGGGRTASTKGHAAQTGIYAMLVGQDPQLGIGPENVETATEIVGMSTTTGAIASGQIPDALTQVVGTQDQPGLIEYAATYLRSGLFPPNPASVLCSEKFCPRWHKCRFHS